MLKTFTRLGFPEPQNYDWGLVNGLTTLLGWVPTEQPEAEIWYGAHALSPTPIQESSHPNLEEWEKSTGHELRFLLKVLSIAKPLSLQVHPDAEQARSGHESEEQQSLSPTDPSRNYPDANPKPEMVVALTDGFEALCGFRPKNEISSTLELLASGSEDSVGFQRWQEMIQENDGVKTVLEWWTHDIRALRCLTSQVADAARDGASGVAHLSGLAELHPDDPALCLAVMLNHVRLRAGEALWVAPETAHAYLQGTAIELMAASDNVLRGGFTSKHVDGEQFMRTVDTTCISPPRLTPDLSVPGITSYIYPSPDADGYALHLRSITKSAALHSNSPSIAFAVAGQFDLNDGMTDQTLSRGEAVLIAPDTAVHVNGRGTLFVASSERMNSDSEV